MPRFVSDRERRLWIAVTVAVALILAALYPLQFVLNALRSRNLLRAAVAACFLAGAALVVLFLARLRAPLASWLILAAIGGVYAACALAMDVPQERLHLVEYGALSLLIREAFAERRRSSPPAARSSSIDVLSLGLATAIGWFDECVQGILPNRYYDLRDVAFNASAAALALGAAAALRAAAKR
ncbi:MAG: VanZ family protein [Thermoanaerobaculia bacterium]